MNRKTLKIGRETLGRFWGWEACCISGRSQEGECLERRRRRKEPRCQRHRLGVSVRQGQDTETVPGILSQGVREGGKVGGEDSELMGEEGRYRPAAASPEAEKRNVESSRQVAMQAVLLSQWMQLWALSAGPRIAPMSLHGLCLSYSYLFIY